MATRKVHGHGYVGTLFTSILTNENRVTPFLLSELWMDRSTRSWCWWYLAIIVPGERTNVLVKGIMYGGGRLLEHGKDEDAEDDYVTVEK